MKNLLHIILSLFVCVVTLTKGYAQETVEEKRKRANEFFDDGQWSQAEPLFASVISTAPREHDLNFKYGTCLLYGSKNKEEAIKRLRFSVTSATIDRRAYYYLGRAYHLNYQFNEAAKFYSKFRELATPGDLKGLNVETELKACNHGKKLLANVTDMIVMQKTELKSENFYDLYELDDIGGTLLVTDEFQTKLDKKKGHRPVIHFPSNSPYIYYSSYGEDGATGLDIYVQKKLPGGTWSLPRKVNGRVNTDSNEDYAYMHPNGNYLYFCSQGHNSMGGYDVFRSKYSPGDDSFGPPENMDFAISSPDDDLLFIVDSLNRNAYFSSARESGQGNLTVYKVRVDRIPMQMSVIKGSYFNSIVAEDKEVEIEIEDFSSGRQIGKFNSKKNNGDYLITFPKSGKYKFIITAKGSEFSHLAIVEIPYAKEFRPLKQQMTLKLDDSGEEMVEILDLFDEDFDDPVAVLAEIYREMSKLPPNADQFNLDSLDALRSSDDVFVQAGLDPFTTKSDLEGRITNKLEDIEAAIENEDNQANVAYNLALKKSNEANQKMLELNDLIEQAENAGDIKEKKRLLEQVNDKKEEVTKLNDEAQALIELGQDIDLSVVTRNAEKEKVEGVLTAVGNVEDDDREALANLVGGNKNFFIENLDDKKDIVDVSTEKIRAGAIERKRIQDLSEDISDLNRQKRDLEEQNKELNKQLEATKKKKVIQEIERKIALVEEEIIVLDETIVANKTELEDIVANTGSVEQGEAAELVLADENNNPEMIQALGADQKRQIYNTVQENNLEQNLAEVDKVLDQNNVSTFNIDLYANDEETSNYSMEDWDEAIDEAKEKLRQERLRASDERQKEIDAEFERLEKLRLEKQGQYEVVKENNVSDVKPEIDPKDIVPNYEARQQSIGEIVNEENRKKANIELNYELADEIEKEKNRLESILENDPKNKNAQARLDNLLIIEDNLKAEIKSDEDWMVANSSQSDVSKEDIVTSLYPDYQKNINEAYDIVDTDERAKRISEYNDIVLDKSNERLQELDAILESDPNNVKAKQEKDYIVDLQKDLTANKSEALVSPEAIDIESLSADVEVTDLLDNYDYRKSQIDAIDDEYKRREAENKLYEELVDKARNEQLKLDRLAKEYPDNKIISKRKKALQSIDDDFTSQIDKNQSWLSKNGSQDELLAEQDDVRLANPDYQTEIDKHASIANKREREDAIAKLNNNTKASIDIRLDKLNAELENNPSNEGLQAEIASLSAVKDAIESNPTKPLVPGMMDNGVDTQPSDNDILPNYEASLTEIENNEELTDQQKLEEKVKLNTRIVARIDREISNSNELKSYYPKKSDELSQRIQSLEKLKSQHLDETDEWNESFENIANTERTPISIENLMPGFEGQIANINASNQSDIDKLTAKNKLSENLIVSIDTKIISLETEKSSNPENSETIDKEIEELNNLKSEKQREIASNQTEITALNNNSPGDTAARRTAISIEGLMPDYNSDIASIESSDISQIEKLEQKNELSKTLIAAINYKVGTLEKEKEDNPGLTATIDDEIDKLNKIKEEKQNEISANEENIQNIENGVVAENTNTPDNTENNNTADNTENNNTADNAENNNTADNTENNNTSDNTENNNTADNTENNNTTDNSENNNTSDNTENNNTADNTNTRRGIVTIGDLMPDYDTQINEIKNSDQSDIEKNQRENMVHEALIDKVSAEIAKLESEKNGNPEVDNTIQQDIDKLEAIKAKAEDKIAANQEQLTQLNEENFVRPEITIGSLLGDYEDKMSSIEQSDRSEKDKLVEKNKMNAQLNAAIDLKIESIQNEWEEDPVHGNTYNEEIDKLEELKESKLNEITKNEESIARLDSSENGVASVNSESYNSPEGKETVASLNDELTEINELNADIEGLNEELKATNDEKEIAQIQKRIDKIALTKAKLENDVIKVLGLPNKTEIESLESDLEVDQAIATSGTNKSEEVLEAEENLAAAKRKYKQAVQLRNEAEETDDPIEANEKLTQAFGLEKEAKELTIAAKRKFKTARVIDQYDFDEEVITDVPENIEERKSTAIFDEVEDLRNKANNYYDEANALKTKSASADKKFKDALLIEARESQNKGDLLGEQADDLEEQAENLKEQEDNLLAQKIDPVSVDVDEATSQGIASTDAYKSFYAAKKDGDEKLKEANQIANEIEVAKSRKTRKIKMAVVKTVEGDEDVESVLEEDTEYRDIQAEIDSLLALQKQLKDQAMKRYSDAQGVLDGYDQSSQDNMLALAQKSVAPIEVNDQPKADFLIPATVESDIFRTTDAAIYSEDTPIPVDENYTSGLVYKVQVGAFRNPLPQDHFDKFAPISGEKLNNGITRYMVGYFTKFNTANEAKTEVNEIGYADAFVVAYCNGERISVSKAKQIEAGVLTCESVDVATNNNNNNNADNNSVNDTNTNNNTETENNNNVVDNNSQTNGDITDTANNGADNNDVVENNNNGTGQGNTIVTPPREMEDGDQSNKLDLTPKTEEQRRLGSYYDDPNAAKATQIETVKGLLYTVQIGVYSKPITNGELFNIVPLNTQRTESGYIRYSTGIFLSREDASIRKDEVVAMGVQDAFVTAYFNGERITVEQALNLLIKEGSSVLVGNYKGEGSDIEVPSVDEPTVYPKEELYYKILIGKYEEAIPGEYATLLLQADEVFETQTDVEGRTCLVSGRINEFDDLVDRLVEFADLGIEDMDIVTYYKYDIIPFNQGEKINQGEAITRLETYDEVKGISADPYIYNKEAVYFKVKLGEFEDKIPSDFTNLLFIHEAEENINIVKEETIDNEIIFYTSNFNSYKEAAEARLRLIEKGFERAIIVAYHKYEEISVKKAREITQE